MLDDRQAAGAAALAAVEECEPRAVPVGKVQTEFAAAGRVPPAGVMGRR